MICAPCSLASSRSREASCLASASCCRYWSSSSLASACASSERARPPSISSVRSDSVLLILGISILPRKPNTSTKQIAPMISSAPAGTSGFCDASAARYLMVGSLPWGLRVLLEDERGDQADERERLGQREPDPHVQRDAAGGFRLPGHRLDGVTEDQADADAGADGGETVTDRTDVVDVDGLGRAGGEK